jgi:hypothetical protein
MASTPTYADEKGAIDEIERVDSSNQATIDAFTPEEQKRIIRKVDYRLIPTLGCMYCVSLMDRTNLGVAMVAGMGVDLKLTGQRYSLIVLLFFITYVALQPPATVVLRKIGPRRFLPAIVVIWGTVMIGFGFVKEWHTLLPLRLLLGIFEAGFFPGKLLQQFRVTLHVLIASRLCLPPQLLVPALRAPEAQHRLLRHRHALLRLLRHPRLPLLSSQRPRRAGCALAGTTLRTNKEEPKDHPTLR